MSVFRQVYDPLRIPSPAMTRYAEALDAALLEAGYEVSMTVDDQWIGFDDQEVPAEVVHRAMDLCRTLVPRIESGHAWGRIVEGVVQMDVVAM